ncbi:hypothetical protein [Microbacterium sp. P5_E9]
MPRSRNPIHGGAVTLAVMMVFCMFAFATPSQASAAEIDPCELLKSIEAPSTASQIREAERLLEDAGQPTDSATILACLVEPKTPATSVTPKDFGEWWAQFQKDVLTPITAMVAFWAAFVFALIALGRILAFVPPFRDPKRGEFQHRSTRRLAVGIGLALSVVVPSAVMLRGVWLMQGGGPKAPYTPDAPFAPQFAAALATFGGGWWFFFLVLSVFAIWVWSFVFASAPRVTLNLKGSDDGKGLDSSQLMAAINGLAGGKNRGIEIPVGTDLTTAAEGVAELSDNTFVKVVQATLRAIFGTTPWVLSAENESDDAVSITISRNGKLMTAKRIRVAKPHPLAGIDEVPIAERLAALVAGELVATLRTRYRPEFDPKLYGATDGQAIGLHYLASTTLAASAASRAKAVEILELALTLDPSNRAVWATRANFVYRNPAIHLAGDRGPHESYRRALLAAIENELARLPHVDDPQWIPQIDDGFGPALIPTAARNIPEKSLLANGLLPRLLQAYAAVEANLAALGDIELIDTEIRMRRLRIRVQSVKRTDESSVTRARRRQFLLIDEFRRARELTGIPPILRLPPFGQEKKAWEERANRPEPGVLALRRRFDCEDAALAVSGDFAHDPDVAYALACYRSANWWLAAPQMEE